MYQFSTTEFSRIILQLTSMLILPGSNLNLKGACALKNSNP